MLREDELAGAAAAPERIVHGCAFWLPFAASFALNSIGNLFVLFPLWVVKLGGGAGAIGAIVARIAGGARRAAGRRRSY